MYVWGCFCDNHSNLDIFIKFSLHVNITRHKNVAQGLSMASWKRTNLTFSSYKNLQSFLVFSLQTGVSKSRRSFSNLNHLGHCHMKGLYKT